MLIDMELTRRAVIAELARREAASIRVTISAKSGGATSTAKRELADHAAYLEATADLLVSSFDTEKETPTIVLPESVPSGKV